MKRVNILDCTLRDGASVSYTHLDRLSQRKGELQAMTPLNAGTTRLEFIIPARGLIG